MKPQEISPAFEYSRSFANAWKSLLRVIDRCATLFRMKHNLLTILSTVLFCGMLFACNTPAPRPTSVTTDTPAISSPTEKAVFVAETTIAVPTATPAPEPTVTPTPEPTATPAPTAAHTPEPTIVPISDEDLNNGALDSFFNDSVLLGDSMTAGFSHFLILKRGNGSICLGNMKCIGQGGLFLKHAYQIELGTRSAVLPYRGRTYSISDLVQVINPKTLYLLLGVNDVYVYNNTIEDSISYFDIIIHNAQEKSPDVQIVLITIPPVTKTYAKDFIYDSQYNIDINEALYQYCEENGFGIVDLATRVRGEDGYLNQAFSSDNKFHLNLEGNALWLEALREYARTQYENGAWMPEETAVF